VRESGTVTHNLEAAEHDLQLSRYGIGLLTAINIVLMVTLGMGHARRMAMADATRAELEEESARLDRKVRARTRQLSALAAHLQRVTEDEKTRLARELRRTRRHPHRHQAGSALGADARARHASGGARQADARDAARGPGHQIKRQLIEDLRPTVLLNLGLREAIVQLVEDVGTRNQWDTALDLPGDAAKTE
jgi:signal transduction histidine kinase